MTWSAEQAANDLERYVLRKEPPAIEACKVLIGRARDVLTCNVPHGHIITLSDGTELYESACSECGAYIGDEDNYCSICGAKVVPQND